jgi:RHS repeat-associated protein
VLGDGNAVYTPGVSETRSGTATYSHSGLKHTAAQSGQSGSVTASREYDAFGGVASSSGSWQGPFGAAGAFGYQTEASGLHLLGHRYYDSSVGRFITRDPIGDGSNWYAYCANDPVAFVDFDGLKTMALTGSDLLADGDRIDYRFGDVGDAVDRAIIDGIETGFGGLGNAFSFGLWQPGPDVRGRAGYDFSVGAGGVAVHCIGGLVGKLKYLPKVARVGEFDDAAKGAKAIMGESMERRVLPVARRMPWLDTFAPSTRSRLGGFLENMKWVFKHCLQGHDFVDLGIDMDRPNRSWYYRAERIVIWFFE